MHAGFVINDPARAFRIDKRAINHHPGGPAGGDSAQPQFRTAFSVRIQHPAAAHITDTVDQRLLCPCRSRRNVVFTDALGSKRMPDRGFQPGDARRIPFHDAVFADPLQPAVHHAPDMSRSLSGPGKLEIILHAR